MLSHEFTYTNSLRTKTGTDYQVRAEYTIERGIRKCKLYGETVEEHFKKIGKFFARKEITY